MKGILRYIPKLPTRTLIFTGFLLFLSNNGIADERVKSFNVNIALRNDGSIVAHETIKVISDGATYEQNAVYYRGVYRFFGIREQGRFAFEHLRDFRVIELQMDGQKAPFEVVNERYYRTVYLGPKKLVLTPGEHEFSLIYSMDRLIKSFPDRDEFFWWVFGTGSHGWAKSIDSISITVKLPENAKGTMYELHNYTVVGTGNVLSHTYFPKKDKEYFLIKIELPKGVIRPPDLSTRVVFFLRDMEPYLPIIIGLIILFLYYIIVWAKAGKDPVRGIIVPRYTPPDDLSPAAIRCLFKSGYDDKAFAAALINLIAKGSMRLEKENETYVFQNDGTLRKPLSMDEQVLAEALFLKTPAGKGLSAVPFNALSVYFAYWKHKRCIMKNMLNKHFVKNLKFLIPGILISCMVAAISRELVDVETSLTGDLWMLVLWTAVSVFLCRVLMKKRVINPEKPFKLIYPIVFAPVIVFGAGALIGYTTDAIDVRNAMFTIPLLIMISGNVLFYYLMKAPTPLGRKMLDEIEGFLMFLSSAEKERLQYLFPEGNAPESLNALFPYAVALDVEHTWTKQISGEVGEHMTLPFVNMIIDGVASVKKFRRKK